MRLGWLGAALPLTLVHCVLADPPPTLPPVEEGPPNIVSYAPLGPILATWPTDIEIEVTVIDPTVTLYAEAFEDYSDYGVNSAPIGQPDEFPPTGDAGAPRHLLMRNLPPPTGPGCHTLRIFVANAVNGLVPTSFLGSPSVQWVYAGGGEDCMAYDAGSLADGTFPGDATPDGAAR